MSIRTTVLRLKTGEPCGNFKVGFDYDYSKFPNLTSSPSYHSVAGSREFETVTCVIHPLRIKSSVAIITSKNGPILIT